MRFETDSEIRANIERQKTFELGKRYIAENSDSPEMLIGTLLRQLEYWKRCASDLSWEKSQHFVRGMPGHPDNEMGM